MKKYLLGIVGVLALTASGPAGAADMPVKAPPLAAPAFNWSRCYVGGHVGYGWGKNTNNFGQAVASGPTETFETVFFPQEFGPFNHNTSGGVLGVQAGCNWLLTPQLLIGIEGEAFWSGIKGGFTAPEDFADPGTFSRFESRNLWDIDLAWRVGWVSGTNLWYVKAGGVLGGFSYTEWHDDFPTRHGCPGGGTCSVTLNQTVPGVLVGFGWETVIPCSPPFPFTACTFKAEWDFIQYPSHSVAYPSMDTPPPMQNFPVKDTKNIFKIGVNLF